MPELKSGTAAWWNAQVEDRLTGLRKVWLDEADKIVTRYEAEDRQTTNCVFNILYSNTETLLPALYNSTPRPDVARRYSPSATERRLDSAVGQTAERLLEYSEDSGTSDYDPFDGAARAAVLGGLVPGMGQVRVRMLEEGAHQELVYDHLNYDRFIWSFARKWCQVTWVGFGHDLNQEGFEEQFPDFCRKDEYKTWAVGGWKALKEKYDADPAGKPRDWQTGQKLEPALLVWEIWDHEHKGIKWICSEFKDSFQLEEQYPFNLTTRFPCPEPLKFIKRNGNLTPRPLYAQYKDQDMQLQEISRRLLRVFKAIRARGAYDSRLTELEKIFGQDSDNALVPIEGAASLGDGADLSKAIWMVPVDTLINVATKLIEAQTSIKNTIYEITGVGDLLRGQAEGVQTAEQAGIQSKWATLRLKRWQSDVATFCRDLFRIAFEFMANCYSLATIRDITKLEYLTQAEKIEIQTAMGRYQQQVQQLQAMQQQMAQAQGGQPGQQVQGAPPPQLPPPPVPQERLDLMQFPTWEEIVGVMKDKFERTYRIDVETNSTVDLEATEDKASMSEFMNAFGQMAAGMQNFVETGMMSFDVSKTIMGELFRRYRFGRRIEQSLEMMTPPQGAGQGAAAGLQAQLQSNMAQHQAQIAAKEAQIQQGREMLERERAQAKNGTTELVAKIKELEIQLTAARAQKQVTDATHQHDMVAKDVAHANQMGGVQRNLEMERLNRSRDGFGHEQEVAGLNNQLITANDEARHLAQRHELEGVARAQDEAMLKGAHQTEVSGLKQKLDRSLASKQPAG